ncbi:thiamine ABC transporter substrate binding subunit [Isoptericola variabilis]|uniref:ABC transporter, periplasmic binding protein, thiB subfamily n=1 Tax=Isoptericola variabilis (strain 225) TaxID=743718 RepID=F6FV83_ISOV2|nr:thiamine ABC transporter substrate-binding protein [Isoptericola variabilis]AEG45511.1 ABC transporter, periplasmic binding protein, thiB subfamily [Isoptericola variabilis 225]TWH33799.1 thiamine transport system substrate-binding protein [Isoptericola variabilis J7]
MTTSTRRTIRAAAASAAVGLVATTLAACGGGEPAGPGDAASPGGTSGGTVTLVTHDSFAVSEGVLESFEEATGYTVEQVAPGDAGTLVNQLVLTKDSPLGDVVYGIDNTFASRAIAEGVLEPYQPEDLDPSAARYATGQYDVEGALTPIDVGDVCLNIDTAWFEENGVAEPRTLEDVTKPEYADLTVVTNPATSSPGLAFLLATVGAFGEDGWQGYWEKLRDNGVKVVDSWSDAYYVDFSGAGEGGQRPIALSYSTSPAFTVTEDGTQSTTAALLETCFRQVEYAGVLAGTDNPEGARALVDFLASPEFQADIPGQMYMYPADETVELPAEWQQFAPLSDAPFEVPPADVAEHRDEWIEQWTATVIG